MIECRGNSLRQLRGITVMTGLVSREARICALAIAFASASSLALLPQPTSAAPSSSSRPPAPRPSPPPPPPRPSPSPAAKAPAPRAAPAPAPAPRPPAPPAAQKPANFGAPSPGYGRVTMNAPLAAAPAAKAAAVQPAGTTSYSSPPPAYGKVNVNAPLADTKPHKQLSPANAANHAQTDTAAVNVGAQSTARRLPASTNGMVAGAGLAAAVAGAAAATPRTPTVPAANTTPAKPAADVSRFAPETAGRLAPHEQAFRTHYSDVPVARQPSTSGWTWLFLAWALHSESKTNKVEHDNAALRQRMLALEKYVKEDPAEWEQLQLLDADAQKALGASTTGEAQAIGERLAGETARDAVSSAMPPPWAAYGALGGVLLFGGLVLGGSVFASARRG